MLKKRFIWLVVLPIVLLVCFMVSPVLASWVGIPAQVRLFPGSEFSMYVQLPFRLTDAKGEDVTGLKRQFSFISDSIGKQQFQVRLFGLIPVRDMVVDVVPEVKIYPGGQSIGVLINPTGLVVSRVGPVRGLDGREYFPAAKAGILPGDIILAIEDYQVHQPEQVGQIINTLAPTVPSLKILIRRNERTLTRQVTPVLSQQEDFAGNIRNVYLLGVFLEDPAAGVGTLTFYDPVSGRYGALGHTIADGLGRSIEISQGSIVQASIDSIKQGLRGLPGEKLGTFQDERDILGTIDKNTVFGIYGNLANPLHHPYFNQPLSIALAHQVEAGPAQIYTVINGDTIQKFDIEITKVIAQKRPGDKGLVLRVTDPRLLDTTGGIVQGMSGSPIVQNKRIVGAVTHVFINNPTMGYGSFIEWMVYEAGIARDEATTMKITASCIPCPCVPDSDFNLFDGDASGSLATWGSTVNIWPLVS